MERLLPSEIARLVLGYLEEEKFKNLAQEFLESSRYLGECLQLAREGEEITTRPYGKNLREMLKEYCALQKLVTQQVKKLPQQLRIKFTKLTIVEQLQHLLLLQKAPLHASSDDSHNLRTSDMVPRSQIIDTLVAQCSSSYKSPSPTKTPENEKENEVPCCNNIADEIAVDSSPAPTPTKYVPRNSRSTYNKTQFDSRTSTPKKKRTKSSFKRKWSATPVKSPTASQKLRREFRHHAILDPLDFKIVSTALMDNKRLQEKIAENINRIIIDKTLPANTKSDVPSMSMDLDAMLNEYILEIVNKTELDPLFEDFVDEVLAAPDLQDRNTEEDPSCLHSPKRKQLSENSVNMPPKLQTDTEREDVPTKSHLHGDFKSNAAGPSTGKHDLVEESKLEKRGNSKVVDWDSNKENRPKELNQITETQACSSSKKQSTLDQQCDAAVQSIINAISTDVGNNDVSSCESSQSLANNKTESQSQTDDSVPTTRQTDLLLDAIRRADIIVVNDNTSEMSVIPATPLRLTQQAFPATPSRLAQQTIPATPLTQFFQQLLTGQSSQLSRQVTQMTQSPQPAQQVNSAASSQYTQNTVPMTSFSVSSNTASEPAQIIISVNNDPVPEPSSIVSLDSSQIGLIKPAPVSEPTVLMYDFNRKALVPVPSTTSVLGAYSPLTAATRAAMKTFIPIAPKKPKVVQRTDIMETASILPQEKLISVEANLKTGITITTEQGSSIHFSNPPGTLLGLPVIDSPVSAKSTDFISQQPSLNSALLLSVEKQIPVQNTGLPTIENTDRHAGTILGLPTIDNTDRHGGTILGLPTIDNTDRHGGTILGLPTIDNTDRHGGTILETSVEQRTEIISGTVSVKHANKDIENVSNSKNEDNVNLKNKDDDSPLKTPIVKSVTRNRSSGNKRLSLSTPRQRYRHVRALDFSTPRRRGPPSGRKSNTSPKVSSTRTSPRLSSNLSRSICRGGLFSSPPKKKSPVKKMDTKVLTSEDNSNFNSLDETCTVATGFNSLIETCTIATRSPRESLEGPWDKVTGVGLIIDPPLSCDVLEDDALKSDYADSVKSLVSQDKSVIKDSTTVSTTAITATVGMTKKVDETNETPDTNTLREKISETKAHAWDSDLRSHFTDYIFKEPSNDSSTKATKNTKKPKTDKSSPRKKSPAKKSVVDKSPAKKPLLSKSPAKKSLLSKSSAKKTSSKSPNAKMSPAKKTLLDKSPAKKSCIRASKRISEASSNESKQNSKEEKVSKQNAKSVTPRELKKLKEVNLEDNLPSTSSTSSKSNRKRYPSSQKKRRNMRRTSINRQKNNLLQEDFSENNDMEEVVNTLSNDAKDEGNSVRTCIPSSDTTEIIYSQNSIEVSSDSSSESQSISVNNSVNSIKLDLDANKRKEFIKIDVGSLTRTKEKSSKSVKKGSKSKVSSSIISPQKVKKSKARKSEMLIQSPTKLNARKVDILNRRSVVCKRIICDPKTSSEGFVESHTIETVSFSKTDLLKNEKMGLEKTSNATKIEKNNPADFVDQSLINTPCKHNGDQFPLTPRVLSPKSYQKTPNIKSTQSFSSQYDPFSTPLFPPTPSIAGSPVIIEGVPESFLSPSYYNPSKETSVPENFENLHLTSSVENKMMEKSLAETITSETSLLSKNSSKTSGKPEDNCEAAPSKEDNLNKPPVNEILPRDEVCGKHMPEHSSFVNADFSKERNESSYESDDSIDIETVDVDVDSRVSKSRKSAVSNRDESLLEKVKGVQQKDLEVENSKISISGSVSNNSICSKSNSLESKRLSTKEILLETACKLKDISDDMVDKSCQKDVNEKSDRNKVNIASETNSAEKDLWNIKQTEKVKSVVDVIRSPRLSDGNPLYKSIFSPSPSHSTCEDEKHRIKDNTRNSSLDVPPLSPIEQRLALMFGEIQPDRSAAQNISEHHKHKSEKFSFSSGPNSTCKQLTSGDIDYVNVNTSVQSSPMNLVKKDHDLPPNKNKYICSDDSSRSSSEHESSDYESDISVGKESVSLGKNVSERTVNLEKACDVYKTNSDRMLSIAQKESELCTEEYANKITDEVLQNTSQLSKFINADPSFVGNENLKTTKGTAAYSKLKDDKHSDSRTGCDLIDMESEKSVEKISDESSIAEFNEKQNLCKEACLTKTVKELDKDSATNEQIADLNTVDDFSKTSIDQQSVNKLFDISMFDFEDACNDIPLICISSCEANERIMSVFYKNLGPSRRESVRKISSDLEENLVVDYEGVEHLVTIKPSPYISLFESDDFNLDESRPGNIPIIADNETWNEKSNGIHCSEETKVSRKKSNYFDGTRAICSPPTKKQMSTMIRSEYPGESINQENNKLLDELAKNSDSLNKKSSSAKSTKVQNKSSALNELSRSTEIQNKLEVKSRKPSGNISHKNIKENCQSRSEQDDKNYEHSTFERCTCEECYNKRDRRKRDDCRCSKCKNDKHCRSRSSSCEDRRERDHHYIDRNKKYSTARHDYRGYDRLERDHYGRYARNRIESRRKRRRSEDRERSRESKRRRTHHEDRTTGCHNRRSPERSWRRSPPRPVDRNIKKSVSNDRECKHNTPAKSNENQKRKSQDMISPLESVYPDSSKLNRRNERSHKSHNVHKSKESRREYEKHVLHHGSSPRRKVLDIISRNVRYSRSPGRNFFFRNSCERDLFQDSEVSKYVLSGLHKAVTSVASQQKDQRLKKNKSHDETLEDGEISDSDHSSSYEEEVNHNVRSELHQDNLSEDQEQTDSINSRISVPVSVVKEIAQSPCSGQQIVKLLQSDISSCTSSVGNIGSNSTSKSEFKSLPLKKRKASTDNGTGKVMGQKCSEPSDSKSVPHKSDAERLESSDPKALLNKLDLDQFLSAVHGSKGS